MKIKFWGTRGLISSPGKDTAVYGGNTSCMQILHKNHIIIVDTGFGACNLGEQLMARILEGGEKLNIHIFFTHFHWDHIQGLPFFHPIYFETSTINIYSPLPVNVAHENLNLLFDGSYSPFAGIDSMASSISFHQLSAPVLVGGLTVESLPLDHGHSEDSEHASQCFALRFSTNEHKIVIATDHEARPSETNKNLLDFARNADIFVHDAQYNEEEYASKVGWGHSTYTQAIENGKKSSAKKILLTHHHPTRTDEQIDKVAQKLSSNPQYAALDFEFAKEDTEYDAS